MKINLIAAISENFIIGKDGEIPWKIPGDLPRFKHITMGNPIVMGRKTFESIGRPLPGRENIVLSRQTDYRPDGVTICNHVDFLTTTSKYLGMEEIFVIGGEVVYEAFLPFADKLYLTIINGHYEGDASFPMFNKDDFDEVENKYFEGVPGHRYLTLERR